MSQQPSIMAIDGSMSLGEGVERAGIFPFLCLPAELRAMVYIYFFSGAELTVEKYCKISQKTSLAPKLPKVPRSRITLLLLCKHIESEAYLFLCNATTLRTISKVQSGPLINFMSVQPKLVSKIGVISIDLDWLAYKLDAGSLGDSIAKRLPSMYNL